MNGWIHRFDDKKRIIHMFCFQAREHCLSLLQEALYGHQRAANTFL